MIWQKLLMAGGGGIEFVGRADAGSGITTAAPRTIDLTNLYGGSDTQVREGDLVFIAVSDTDTSSTGWTVEHTASYFTILSKVMGPTPDTSYIMTDAVPKVGLAMVFRAAATSPVYADSSSDSGNGTGDALCSFNPVTVTSGEITLAFGYINKNWTGSSFHFTGAPGSDYFTYTHGRGSSSYKEMALCAALYYDKSGSFTPANLTHDDRTSYVWRTFLCTIAPK
ncbi:hypothetical protein PXK58_00930 [Phaeobacter gallaeciensis]|uniref:hypothetical protein n=1 Tax=Phaeobacter gallaeciensis TaxID=60890 RepID=UPI002380C14E|nr:hypothetical protein [Phaeobacter gallaeciensis]MDE4272950.1 hypothetical protein [Phaeobacter gallaeciensis]MDE4298097.1 hypothetical protein [Phaeobacter gallaeciensis]MDE5183285.1 hypothetical protein [Phaeobacter gallaeciensis]